MCIRDRYHLVENSDGQELSAKIGAMCMEFEQIDEKQYSDNPIVDSVLRIKFGLSLIHILWKVLYPIPKIIYI